MTVRRTLPQRDRSLIGAWCFVDHYGPDRVADTGGMTVAPHPHTGLQTVSWLFTGEIEHRDSAGHHAMVRPGEVNLMTAGRGISHSEVSTAGHHRAARRPALGGAARRRPRRADPAFEHHAPEPVAGDGWAGAGLPRLAAGDHLAGRRRTPRCSAPSWSSPRAPRSVLDVDAASSTACCSTPARPSSTGRRASRASWRTSRPDARRSPLEATTTCAALLLGGPPFGESIVMWWNFVGRTHEEVVAFREEWQAQVRRGHRRPGRPVRPLRRRGRRPPAARSPPRRCPTRGCASVADALRGPSPGRGQFGP